MKYIILLAMFFISTYSYSQTVKIIVQSDTTWYSMDKTAAQNIIYNANKGVNFDSYRKSFDLFLNEVLKAKVKSDSIQMVLQQDLTHCKSLVIMAEKDKVKLYNSTFKLSEDKDKFKRQRNTMLGISAALLSMLIMTY
jgi:hypothetical protein